MSDIQEETNYKDRLLWCSRCDKDFTNRDRDPRCPECGKRLITVLFIEGKRITGVKNETSQA